jgi:hypothetical protein
MNVSATILWITLAVTGASTPVSAAEKPADKKESFGAVVGPAFLPAGATAAYAFVGLPEVGAGFRQGLGFGEWEARARVDYLTLSATAEVVGKHALYRWGKLDYGPFLGLGATLSSGARYFDSLAFTYAGLRVLGGVALTYRMLDTLLILARLDVPFDWPLTTGGGGRLRALAGGGVELYLSDDISATAVGQVGMDWFKEPLGVTVGRLGYSLVLGVGIRLF